ncbi:MAG: ATPase [Tabrizicola sp.]|nr:ATPase [Tabrizicola sp.]
MAETAVDHGTVIVGRMINRPAARVFAAYADANERVRWAAPSDTAVFFYEKADFRVGGLDVARCGAREDPRFRVESRYMGILPGHRIVTVDTVHEDTTPLSVSITTVEFSDSPDGAQVKVTVQVTSFAGAGMIDNTRDGTAGSLNNLVRYLERPEA